MKNKKEIIEALENMVFGAQKDAYAAETMSRLLSTLTMQKPKDLNLQNANRVSKDKLDEAKAKLRIANEVLKEAQNGTLIYE